MKNYEEMARCVLEARDGHIRKKKLRRDKIKKYAPVVSALCLAALLGLGVLHHINGLPHIPYQTDIAEKTEPTAETETIHSGVIISQTLPPVESWGNPPIFEIPPCSGSDEDPYNGSEPLHWNEMTINQQFNMAEFGQPLVFYQTAEKEVADDRIGDFICMAYMSGYDFYSDTYYHCDAEAYEVKNDESIMIAIKFSSNDQFYQYNLITPNQNHEQDGLTVN